MMSPETGSHLSLSWEKRSGTTGVNGHQLAKGASNSSYPESNKPPLPTSGLLHLLGQVRLDDRGWDGPAGSAVVRIVRARVRREEARWSRRAGDLGEAAVSEVWEALDRWVRSGDTADPELILSAQVRRKTAGHAAAAQTGIGSPRTVGMVSLARQMLRVEFPEDSRLAGESERDASTLQVVVPAWMRVLAMMLVKAGWDWQVPPDDALVAAVEAMVFSRRRSRSPLVKQGTGIPAGTWSALELLVDGSAPSCRVRTAWPSPAQTYRLQGARAVRNSVEVQRLVAAAVAGAATRSGRDWIKAAAS